MPQLKKTATKGEKKARAKEEFDKFGKGQLKSSSGHKVTNPKQAVAIALSESGQSKKNQKDPDSRMLDKYQHHKTMAQKHHAHADLIEAKLRTQGKRIGYADGPSYPSSIRKIVSDNG